MPEPTTTQKIKNGARCVISKESPEWGIWTVTVDNGEWFEIRAHNGQGERVLFYESADRFWEIAE